MFVDACAVISIMAGEDTAECYQSALDLAEAPFTSALAAWEAVLIMARPGQLDCTYSQAKAVVVDWLCANRIALHEPGNSRDVLAHAVTVAEQHGLGKRALSNFDCFHYAHAKVAGAPLLTLDRLLRETDIETVPADA